MIRYIANAASLTVVLSALLVDMSATAGSSTPKTDKAADSAAGKAPQASTKEDPSNPILAKVGDKVVRKSDVDQKFQELKKTFDEPENKGNPAIKELLDPKNKTELSEKLLEGVINNILIEEGAAKIKETEEFKQTAASMVDTLAKKNFLTQEADKKITDSEIKEKYDLFVKSRSPEDQVFISIIQTTEESKAKEAFGKLAKGEDFSKVAKAYSTDEKTKSLGGENKSPIRKSDQTPKELIDAIFATAVGKTCDKPIRMETDLGQGKKQVEFLIFKVTKREAIPAPTLEQLKEPLKGLLREAKLPDVIDNLRKNAKVELFKYDASGNAIEKSKDDAPKADENKPAVKK